VRDVAAELEALRALRATGVLSARTADGRMITYRSDDELARAIAALEVEVAHAAAVVRPRVVRVIARSGW